MQQMSAQDPDCGAATSHFRQRNSCQEQLGSGVSTHVISIGQVRKVLHHPVVSLRSYFDIEIARHDDGSCLLGCMIWHRNYASRLTSMSGVLYSCEVFRRAPNSELNRDLSWEKVLGTAKQQSGSERIYGLVSILSAQAQSSTAISFASGHPLQKQL